MTLSRYGMFYYKQLHHFRCDTLLQCSYSTEIICGKSLAQSLYRRLKARIKVLDHEHAVTPTLSIIQIGQRHEESQVYIRMKLKAAAKLGVHCEHICLDENATQSSILDSIQSLNRDERIHGILVQLPIPNRLESSILLDAIAPWKDVDGLHSYNVGQLSKKTGKPYFTPCTANAILALLKAYQVDLSGLHAVILGRSDLVGLPTSQLLLKENATVTICHSKTRNLEQRIQGADILVVAIGQPRHVPGHWIPKDSIVIDVGIHLTQSQPGQAKSIVGDIQSDKVIELGLAKALTLVPGGVGPMTVAHLMENVVLAAERSIRASPPHPFP